MANDVFTEVTTESWFGRIQSSIKGVLFGIILFLVSFVLLFWNEGRAVKAAKTLEEGLGLVVSVASEPVDSGNDGKLVHTTGEATTDETLTDPQFGVLAHAVKLRREVQMYQWTEDEHKESKKKLVLCPINKDL